MGDIVGAALVSHHPGLMQPEEFRRLQGAGTDSDLIPGFARLRERLLAAQPDVVVIFDTHWFTTGYHLVDGGARYSGTYISDEMPWYLKGVPYDYRGLPRLALDIEAASRERGGYNRAVCEPTLQRHYATLNVIKLLSLDVLDIPVVSASSCQNCHWSAYLESGATIGQAIRRSDHRIVLLASGALSHKFNDIEWQPKNPRIFDETNISSPENAASDKRAIELLAQGRHDVILQQWDVEYRRLPWEAFGAHYLQMVGAMGGKDCTAKGIPLSDYENARGTGNIHIWFEQ
jgi:3,4-dihydroxyphenylacetate 2,3-dioxygenase